MTHSGPWLPLILCIQHGAVTPRGKEGRERWEEGGRGVCMRATDRSMLRAHAPPSVICTVRVVVRAIFHQGEISSRYIHFNLIKHTRQLFWTTWRDSLCNMHHARHTHTDKHRTKGRVYWASGQNTANLLLPFGSSHFQTPKSIHFTPPPTSIYICSDSIV